MQLNRFFTLMMTLLITVAIAGCANYGGPRASKRNVGAVIGGVAGGVAGSQIGSGEGKTIATIVGALAGTALGGYVGKQMEQQDRQHVGRVLEANPTGQTSTWTNPDTGNTYAVTPTQTYQANGGPCRKFRMRADMGQGQSDNVNDSACRQPDGTWKVQ